MIRHHKGFHSHARHYPSLHVKHHVQSIDYSGFINEATSPAQTAERSFGVPASITVAQAILESGWGLHHAGAANNYFGIKANKSGDHYNYGSVATGYVLRLTREHENGQDIYKMQPFRTYRDMLDSFFDHALFLIQNPRYRAALDVYANDGDADEFARGLQRAGYAGDPHYAELLISIMRKRELYKLNIKKIAQD